MIEELNGDFLQWLRGFYFVARTGSVRKAAQLMHRNPSTISYQLRCLEEELNVVLFDRVKRSLRITDEGKKLLGWAISTFETLKSLRDSVSNSSGSLKGNIHMAGTLPIITLAVPAIAKFIQEFPHVILNIERGLSPDVRRRVTESETDFGLAAVSATSGDVKMEILFKARPLLVYRKPNAWRIPPVPSMDDLKRLPFICFRPQQGLYDDMDFLSGTEEMGEIMNKNALLFVNNYHLILRFIWHGLGVSVMDELCYHATHFGAEWEKISAVPLDHILPNRLYGIMTRKLKRLSPPALALIRELRTHFLNLPSLYAREAWQRMQQQPESEALENY